MRFRHKLDNVMWFIIYNLPLVLLLVVAIYNMGATEQTSFATILADWSTMMPSLTENVIAKAISDLFNYFGANGTLFGYGIQYVTFVIFAHFLKIIEFVLVFFVHLAENLIEKISGGKD